MTLTFADRDKLGKLLALAGSTNQDGEAATAVRMAARILKSHGSDWHTLLAILGPPTPAAAPRPSPQRGHDRWWTDLSPGHVRTACELLRRGGGTLSTWEAGFLDSIQNHARLTPKQGAVLDRIARKVDLAGQTQKEASR
jgi:hypothetical protein